MRGTPDLSEAILRARLSAKRSSKPGGRRSRIKSATGKKERPGWNDKDLRENEKPRDWETKLPARKHEIHRTVLEQQKCLYLVNLCAKDTTTPSGRSKFPEDNRHSLHLTTFTATLLLQRKCFYRFRSAPNSLPSSLHRHVRAVHFHDWTFWLKYSLKWDGGRGGMGGDNGEEGK